MIRRLLVPLDGSEVAECVLPHAGALASAFEAPLLLLRVVGGGGPDVDSLSWRLGRAEAEAYLAEVADRFARHGVTAEWQVEEGRASEQILQVARERSADLVMLSSHGERGITEFGLSGTAYKVAFDGRVSIMLVRAARRAPEELVRYRKVLVPVDCSKRAEWAVSHASSVAKAEEAELVLVNVVPPAEVLEAVGADSEAHRLARRLRALNEAGAADYLNALAARLEGPSLRVRTRVTAGGAHVVQTLQDIIAEEDPGIVVMACHGAQPCPGSAYGGVALALLSRGDTPLLLLRDRAPVRRARRGEAGRWPEKAKAPA